LPQGKISDQLLVVVIWLLMLVVGICPQGSHPRCRLVVGLCLATGHLRPRATGVELGPSISSIDALTAV
jgi:hypothetical protein